MAALDLLHGEAEALTRKAVDMALDGDIAALRLCLERLIPVRRDAIDLNLNRTEVRVDLRQIAVGELSKLELFLARVLISDDAEGSADLES